MALRQLFRLSLRALFALLTLFCLWLAIEAHEARQRRAAVTWVLAQGGVVQYDWQVNSEYRYLTFGLPLAPQWLRAILGDDFFQEVRLVNLADASLNDLSPLDPLVAIECLILTNNDITDLTPLRRHRRLRVLLLDRNEIRNVTPLADLAELRHLSLAVNQVEDASPLQVLTELVELNLHNNRLASLEPLSGLRKLRILDASANRLTECRSLARLPSLQLVDLRQNQLAGADVAWLHRLPDLDVK